MDVLVNTKNATDKQVVLISFSTVYINKSIYISDERKFHNDGSPFGSFYGIMIHHFRKLVQCKS